MLTSSTWTSLQTLCQKSWTTCFNVLQKWIYRERLIFFTEFEHSTPTLKVQRLCIVQPSYCQASYLTVWFYVCHCSQELKAWINTQQCQTQSINLLFFFFPVPLWVAPHCYWGIHEHADRHPCKIYLALVLFWVPNIYIYLCQPRPFPIREQLTIIYVQMHHKRIEHFIFLSFFSSCISKPISFRFRQDCTAALHRTGKKTLN